MKKAYVIFGILIIILLQSICYAETDVQRKVSSPTFTSFTEYRSWERKTGEVTEKISQLSTPTFFMLPITRNLAIDLATSFISSKVNDGKLSGISDTKARAVFMLLDDTVMLNAGINLPTGKSEMSLAEIATSSTLSSKALGFKYNRLGDGLDLNLGGGVAKSLGPLIFGAGAGYLVKGEYKYLNDYDFKYKPGNQVNATGGLDIAIKPLLLRSDVTFTSYQSDKVDSKEVFKEGTRLSVEETIAILSDPIIFLISGRYINRGKSEVFDTTQQENADNATNQVDANIMLNLKIAGPLRVKLLVDAVIADEKSAREYSVVSNRSLNSIKENNYGASVGFGGGIVMKFSKSSFLDISMKYLLGETTTTIITDKGVQERRKIDVNKLLSGDTSLKGLSLTTNLRLIF